MHTQKKKRKTIFESESNQEKYIVLQEQGIEDDNENDYDKDDDEDNAEDNDKDNVANSGGWWCRSRPVTWRQAISTRRGKSLAYIEACLKH